MGGSIPEVSEVVGVSGVEKIVRRYESLLKAPPESPSHCFSGHGLGAFWMRRELREHLGSVARMTNFIGGALQWVASAHESRRVVFAVGWEPCCSYSPVLRERTVTALTG